MKSAVNGAVTKSPLGAGRPLRLLSYNIQAGIDTRHYRDYVTQGWKHLLPHRERQQNLDRIASMLGGYDIVGLQEVDAGSLRSGFVDQIAYLAHRGGFAHSYTQVNRNMGKFAQHSNGVLSRMRPERVTEYRLPGLPGRGAIVAEYGSGEHALAVVIAHLALGRRARTRQMAFLRDLARFFSHVVLMGDFNCGCDAREMRMLMQGAGLHEPACGQNTFPSWRPMRKIDHILVSDQLRVRQAKVLDYPLSDHLPISLELEVPEEVCLAA